MLKILIGASAALLILVGVFAVFLISNLDRIVKEAIETVGTQVAGAPVAVGGVSILLKEGSGELSGIRIANPPGFPAGNAFELQRVQLALDLPNLSRDLVAIDSITVTGATINAIQDATGNNLQALLDNLRRSGKEDGDSVPGEQAEPKVRIGEFRFEDASVSVSVPAAGLSRTAAIPTVVLRDIGGKSGGVSAAEATRQILEPLARRALEASTGLSQEALEQRAREEAGKAIERGQERLKEKLGEFLNP